MRTQFPVGPAVLVGLLGVLAAGTLIGPGEIRKTLEGLGVNISIGGEDRSIALPSLGQGSVRATVSGSRNRDIRRDIWCRTGQTLTFRYQATVDRGHVYLMLTGPGFRRPRLWHTRVEASGSWTVSVPLQATGNHEIVVGEWGFGGGYEVAWELS